MAMCSITHKSLFGLLALLSFGVSAKAQILYHVTVDSHAINGTAGNLDMQFNPGLGAESATTTITGFISSGGTLAGTSTDTGGAAGTLPQQVTIDNSGAFNDLFQGFTFGSGFEFNVAFAGSALNPPLGTTGGSVFALSLYDAAGTTPLLTTSPDGAALEININPDGTTSVQNFPSDPNGGLPVANAFLVTSVPEPGTFALCMVGTCCSALSLWKRRRRIS